LENHNVQLVQLLPIAMTEYKQKIRRYLFRLFETETERENRTSFSNIRAQTRAFGTDGYRYCPQRGLY